ncbi:MAG TPA: 3D domain-containing protein [Chloroflexota bacterium]|nr:3D domain-containing protein [Chloroflexota bacterium]
MTARIIGLATAVGLVAPASLAQVSMTSATTARFFVTGYVLRGYTFTGTYVHPGTCAVDPRVIPLGSYITISGLGTCHAEDTGGAIIGYHIDVWVPTVAQAYALTGWRTASWGPRPMPYVLDAHASQPRSPWRVHSQRWYSHGNAYDHRDTRATARPSAAQPTYSLIKRH